MSLLIYYRIPKKTLKSETQNVIKQSLHFGQFLYRPPSQYLHNTTVRKHGETYEAINPNFTRMVTKHFYIDDLSTGAENVKKGGQVE